MSNSSVPRAQFPARRGAAVGGASVSIVTVSALAVLITATVLVTAVPAKSSLSRKVGSTTSGATQTGARQAGVTKADSAPARTQALVPTAYEIATANRARIDATYAALPLAFEPNEGQTDPQVKYLARGKGYSLFLSSHAAYFALPLASRQSHQDQPNQPTRGAQAINLASVLRESRGHSSRAHAARGEPNAVASVEMEMLESNPKPQITAENPQPGVTNYILGRDPSKWHSGVAHYGQVRYHDVYPGVDMAFHGAFHGEDSFEFDFLVNPGAKPEAVRLAFSGLKELRTTSSGDLVLASAAGDLHLHRPFAYQENNGVRQPVDARFVLRANHRVSFALGNYDRRRQVVIDPTITYSTYLGGSLEDDANAITVDSLGDAYITGETDSTNFPGAGAPVGGFDVFVTELKPSLSGASSLVFTTLVGGALDDVGNAIAVDITGIYVAGRTSSTDFPATTGQTTFLSAPSNHGFLFKLNTTGSLLTWSTLIEGSVGDSALGLAVDSAQEIYVVGDTQSADLGGGTVNWLPGGQFINNGTGSTNDDGFIAKVKSDGSQYLFLSYLGGKNVDMAEGVALDTSGNVYVTGFTDSPDFPVHPNPGAFQVKCGTDGTCNLSGGTLQDDAFVAAITSGNAPTYIYSTYLGGEKADEAFAIAVDPVKMNAYVTGQTKSASFPAQNSVTGLSTLAGTQSAFVASLNSSGTALNYSTYLGGNAPSTSAQAGFGIAVDGNGNAYVTGYTTSTNFPTVAATQSIFGGGNSTFGTDAFVTELNLNGTSLSLPFSTYLGGPGDEDFVFGALAVDSTGKIYVTGVTNSSSNFPLQNAADGTYNSGSMGNCTLVGGAGSVPCPDAFVTVYAPTAGGDFSIAGTALAAVSPGGSSTSTIKITPFNGYSNTVNLTCAVTGNGTPAPTCSFSPSSVAGGSGTSTLTVKTTAATAMLLRPGSHRGTIFYATLLPVAGLALLGLASCPAAGRKRFAPFLCLCVVLGGLLLLPACGGGSSGGGGGGGGSPGTPAGTYTITVTGTDATTSTLTHSIAPPLTLTVN